MSVIDPRGQHDLITDRMVTALKAYAAAQAAINPAVGFRVYSGSYRVTQAVNVPIVAVRFDSMRTARDSAARKAWEIEASYFVDMIASGKAQEGKRGDEAATARLLYLIQQVLNGLYGIDARTTIETPKVAEIGWPDVQLMDPDDFSPEAPLIGARMTIQARFEYVPAPVTGTALTEIHVDADRWSGLYEYGEV